MEHVMKHVMEHADHVAPCRTASHAGHVARRSSRVCHGVVGKLREYHAKRDATRTPEPMPKTARKQPRGQDAEAPIFVVQEHRATALHWDFRLERDGVLLSWALPKGVPTDPARNHRAVRTEDHPVEYADFEGRIPDGEYGAGTVRTYDRGTYSVLKWSDDEVKVELSGKRLSGRYTLFRTGASNADGWMIHREKGQDPEYAPLPTDVAPMLAVPGPLPRKPAGWAAEFKWDGIRALCSVSGGRLKLRSRNGNDLTDSYPEIKALAKTVSTAQLLLDGEIIALDADGKVSFAMLQSRFGGSGAEAERLARTAPASYMVFDLLHLDGHSTADLPYAARRELLESLELAGPHWLTPPSFPDADVPAADVLVAARAQGMEGVVLKRTDSTYQAGTRSPAWRKVKFTASQSAVIGGFTPLKSADAPEHPSRPPREIGALLLGVHGDDGKLRYVGKVGTGFTEHDRRTLLTGLAGLVRADSPFATAVEPADAKAATWVDPVVVAEVTFTEWTSKNRLRHPVFKGIRPDKSPQEVVRES
jgi:bifunctional non-homologous end joining protein LigD